MNSIILAQTIDPNLGHADYSSFSDQTLMEMLLEGFDEKTRQVCQDIRGTYIEVCEWPCVKCDADGSVIEISQRDNVSGSLELRYAPPKMRKFEMTWKHLTGSIDLTQLPENFEELYLFRNQLEGSICLTQLPQNMKEISLSEMYSRAQSI